MSAEEERRALLGLALASLPEEDEVKVRAALAEKAERDARARAEPVRRAQEDAKVSAALDDAVQADATARTELAEDEVEPAPTPPTLSESLGFLAERTLVGGRRSHRLLHLDLLAKMAARRGTKGLDEVRGLLTGFAELAVLEADGVVPPRGSIDGVADEMTEDGTGVSVDPGRVLATVDAFYAAAEVSAGGHHWTRFVEKASGPLNLSQDEIHRPLCTDHQPVLMPNNLVAVRTAVWLWSDQPASSFERWTDPRTWDTSCGLFFKSVALKGGGPPPKGPEFRAEFTETVNVDGANDLSTNLVFSRSIVDEPRSYALGFDLPPGPLPPRAPILVDCGQVTVREDPNAPPENRTSLLAEKYILFEDPAYATWPTVACDLFWTEFAIIMAQGC